MYGCDSGVSFTVKCLMKDNPSLFNFLVLVASTLLFTQAIRICEAPLSRLDSYMDLFDYFNCIWLVAMTMTTGKDND